MTTPIQSIEETDVLPLSFYRRDCREVAVDLLGKYLVRKDDKMDEYLIGKIVETEAYLGSLDPACHFYGNRTKRNKVFLEGAATIYVYLIYGLYNCLNAITEYGEKKGCVLFRAIEPIKGKEKMIRNRKGKTGKELTNGPGKLCQALQIDTSFNKQLFITSNLTIRSNAIKRLNLERIGVSPRIGISKAKDWKLRYFIKNNNYVSKGKKKEIEHFSKEKHLGAVKYT